MIVRPTLLKAFCVALWRKFGSFATLLRGLSSLFLAAFLSLFIFFGIATPAYAQQAPVLLKQFKDSDTPTPVPPSELNSLNDPLFNLVIKDHSDLKTLDEITQQIQPSQQQVFAVHERIVDNTAVVNDRPASRRSVITFNGNPEGEELSNNLALSVFFNSSFFPSATDIEGMAWDDDAGKFNYYKLNRVNGEAEPTWKFRGDSKDADLLSTADRAGSCMACHINGGMVMKEFKAPWVNWHSIDFDANYLRANTTNSWPVANASNSPLQNLTGARVLEFSVESANTRLNAQRIAALKRGDRVRDAKRLLKPLFVTTEFNLMSSGANSTSHPFGEGLPSRGDVNIPLSYFLNDTLLSRAVNVSSSNFRSFASLSDSEYQSVVSRGSTSLGGQTPGDTHFAWVTAEASNIDNTYVTQLIEQGVVPREFVAAVMSVDVENPILSSDRDRLWRASNILPTSFTTGPNNDLIAQTTRNLERLNPASESPEGQLLAALKSPDPVQFLQASVDRYVQRERPLFENNQTRTEEAARLYRKLLESREQLKADPVQKHLIESTLLLPSGNVAALPDTIQVPSGPGTPSGPIANRPTLARGDRGDAVETLQELLQTLDFLNGRVDGDFGPGTEQAVIAAQRAMNLDTDGIVGPNTWSTFERIAALPTLEIGAKGDVVVTLQNRLRDLGVLNGLADGDFGPMTRNSVISAQRRFGLRATGVVSPATWARLAA